MTERQNYTTMTLDQLSFNNGFELSLNDDDIVIFVGPNNVGKTQAIHDIYSQIAAGISTSSIIVRNISTKFDKMEKIYDTISKYANYNKHNQQYSYYGHSINKTEIDNTGVYMQNNLQNIYREFFSSRLLTTSDRLHITVPPPSIYKDQDVRTHPIQTVTNRKDYQKILDDYFYKAFSMHIFPYKLNAPTIPLVVMDEIPEIIFKSNKVNDVINDLSDCYDNYPSLETQGDGMNSFVGILLFLLHELYSIYLIDEPESFLHPPQAYMMGKMIGELSENKQLFLATHSIDILKGLLDSAKKRIKIVRITREGNKTNNEFNVLDNQTLESIREDSLLMHTDILNAIFYNTVILCEGDRDCLFYSTVATHMCQKKETYMSSLFLHSNGKNRMPKVITYLDKLGVHSKIIVDIDLINNDRTLKNFVVSRQPGYDYEKMKKQRKIIDSNLQPRQLDKNQAREKILALLDANDESNLSKETIKKIKSLLNDTSKWGEVKSGGACNIPHGDATKAYEYINTELANMNIFLVEEGELEGFNRKVAAGSDKASWVYKVIDEYPIDSQEQEYDKAIKFLERII